MKPIVVIGLGNPLLTDEGIGVAWVNAMRQHADEFPGVDFLELGTAGTSVLHALANRRAALILDCALMGQAPGTLRRFTPEQVTAQRAPLRFSLHEQDLLSVLALSRRLGAYPAEVRIYGVQPFALEPGEQLSLVLRRRLPVLVRYLLKELRLLERGVERGRAEAQCALPRAALRA